MGSAKDIETAKAEFKAAWEALKARTAPEQLAVGLGQRQRIKMGRGSREHIEN